MSDAPSLRVRRRRQLHLLAALLVLAAAAIVTLAGKIPLPMRLLTASIDLIAASALWLFARQNYSDHRS